MILVFLPNDARVQVFVFFFFLVIFSDSISLWMEVIASVMAEFFMQKHLNLSLALNLGVICLTVGSAPWILDVHACHHLSQCWIIFSEMSYTYTCIYISIKT